MQGVESRGSGRSELRREWDYFFFGKASGGFVG